MRTRRYIVKCSSEPVQLREEASVELSRPAAEIWAWMWDASSNIDLFDAELAMSLPGTPRGVGEVQVVIHRPSRIAWRTFSRSCTWSPNGALSPETWPWGSRRVGNW